MACGAFVALVACSSNDAGEKYPDAASFCSAKANEECTVQAEPCQATVDACKTKVSAACQAAGSQVSGGRAYKASAAEACITKTHDLFNQKTFTSDQEKDWTDTCERVFAGTKAANAQCASDYECSGDMICDKGVCATKVQKNQGEGCSNAGEVCAKGSYCGDQGQLKFCLPRKNSGEICSDTVPCLETLRCQLGSCQDKLNVNDICKTDDDCKATTTSPYCDPVGNKCAAKYTAGTQSCKDLGAS